MSRIVHKQAFDSNMSGLPVKVALPPGSVIVGVGLQQEDFNYIVPQVWYTLDAVSGLAPYAEWDQWLLHLIGTGRPYEDDMEYLAGPYVFRDFVLHLVGTRVAQ